MAEVIQRFKISNVSGNFPVDLPSGASIIDVEFDTSSFYVVAVYDTQFTNSTVRRRFFVTRRGRQLPKTRGNLVFVGKVDYRSRKFYIMEVL